MTSADEVLVIASQSGDRAAFEQLVRRTARLLFARIYLDTPDRHRAEDLVQETYLLAWRSIGQINDPREFRPWLLSIAQRVCIDAHRRQSRKKRKGAMVSEEVLRLVPAAEPSPAESAQQREQREQALAALRALPEEYRQPLMLRYLADADYETISRQLALSNGSLRGLLHRGMDMLRKKLNQT